MRPAIALGSSALACVLAAGTHGSPVAHGESVLDARQVAALRLAVQSARPADSVADELAALVRGAASVDPGLGADDLAAIEDALQRDAPTRSGVQDLLDVALHWRRRDGDHLILWWDGRTEGGARAATPSDDEAAELERLVASTSARFGIPAPHGVPYRIDPRVAVARSFPRSDLRWGVLAPRPVEAAAIVKLVLLEAGDDPYLVEALAILHGTCREDSECRRRMLDRAREAVIHSRYVPILEGVKAGVLASVDDPALASALLVLDHLERLHPPRVIATLVRALPAGTDAATARRVLAGVTGESARRLDREAQRELREWADSRGR